MQRIDNSGAVASLPEPLAAGTPGYFGRGNPGTGLLATPLSADWANMVQEELYAIVLAAGLTPSKTVRTQVRDGIAALYLPKAGGLLTGALGIIAGSAGSPGLYFSGDTNTGIFSAGADQLSKTTAGVERQRIAADGSFSRVVPGGSVLYPEFAIRAWANFSGSGTNGAQTVNASGNTTSVTRTAAGRYQLNMATAMPDANFSIDGFAANAGSGLIGIVSQDSTARALQSSSVAPVYIENNSGSTVDPTFASIKVAR